MQASATQIKIRQVMVFGTLLVIGAAATTLVYFQTQKPYIWLRRAETLAADGRLAPSVALYRRSLESGLKSERGLRRLLEAGRRSGMPVEAMLPVDWMPDWLRDPRTVVALAEAFAAEGRWGDAESVYRHYAAVWKGQPAVMMRLADAYKYQGRYADAEVWYRQALSGAAGSIYARFQLAEMLAWQRRWEEAETLFRSLLADAPENRAARLYLARILGWLGHFDEAVNEYRNLLGDVS